MVRVAVDPEVIPLADTRIPTGTRTSSVAHTHSVVRSVGVSGIVPVPTT